MYEDRTNRELEEAWLADCPTDRERLESLTGLADEIEKVLVRVEPGPEFRKSLRERLSAIMLQRATWRVSWPSEKRRWAFILAATVGSVVSLVGVACYLLRSWMIRKPRHAASH